MILLRILPALVVWLVALIAAIVTWRRHPGVSALTILGTALLLASVVLANLSGALIPFGRLGIRQPFRTGPMLLGIIFFGSLVDLLGWACILLAIFGWRRQPAVPPYPAAPVAAGPLPPADLNAGRTAQ